jgi:hypothetical protein
MDLALIVCGSCFGAIVNHNIRPFPFAANLDMAFYRQDIFGIVQFKMKNLDGSLSNALFGRIISFYVVVEKINYTPVFIEQDGIILSFSPRFQFRCCWDDLLMSDIRQFANLFAHFIISFDTPLCFGSACKLRA